MQEILLLSFKFKHCGIRSIREKLHNMQINLRLMDRKTAGIEMSNVERCKNCNISGARACVCVWGGGGVG